MFRLPDLATDLNGDGVSDIVVRNSVAYGNGDGTFADPVTYPIDSANSEVKAVVAADFNGDGKTDLAVVSSSNRLIVLLNEGSKIFRPVSSYPIPSPVSNSLQLIASDLNGDHKYDLVLIYGGAKASITPYFATGGGALRMGGTYSVGGSAGISAAAGDVNKDGYGDVALIGTTGVKLMLGTSSGAFKSGPSLLIPGAGCAGSCLVLKDFNKDGKLDLAVAGSVGQAPFLNVYLGDGSGGFSNPTVYSAPVLPVTLIAGDVNNSGNFDLVIASTSGNLSLFRNKGNGQFYGAPVSNSPAVNTTNGPLNLAGLPSQNRVATADFNHDGKPDVAVVNPPSCKAPCNGVVTIFPGTGGSYFAPGRQYTIGMHGSAIAAGDLNGDGVEDLVVTNATSGDAADVSVLLGNKDGTFQATRNYTLGSLSNDVFLTDVNKDGKLDLVEDGGVALGNGNGSFGKLVPFPGGLGFDALATLAIGDFNGDGKIDAVYTISSNDCTNKVQILLGKGTGAFTTGQTFNFDFESVAQPITAVTVARLPGRTAQDIIFAIAGGCNTTTSRQFISGVLALHGNGNGTFQQPISLAGSGTYQVIESGPLAIADFNGDGKLDLGVGDPANNQFVVLSGKGDGTFQNQETFTAQTGGNGVAVADFDHNGRPDVVLAGPLGLSRLYNVPAQQSQ
jgi:FG-GAP-like repeat